LGINFWFWGEGWLEVGNLKDVFNTMLLAAALLVFVMISLTDQLLAQLNFCRGGLFIKILSIDL